MPAKWFPQETRGMCVGGHVHESEWDEQEDIRINSGYQVLALKPIYLRLQFF